MERAEPRRHAPTIDQGGHDGGAMTSLVLQPPARDAADPAGTVAVAGNSQTESTAEETLNGGKKNKQKSVEESENESSQKSQTGESESDETREKQSREKSNDGEIEKNQSREKSENESQKRESQSDEKKQ